MTSKEIKAGLGAILAVADAIRELHTVPSGTVYASLMAHTSLERFDSIINILVRADLVQKDGDILRWKGGNP
jgi:hypothetical protein